MSSSVISALNWRYATKKFDPSKKLTDAQLSDLLEALRLTPTSFGLQPYKFIVITDPALREKMKANSWNQSQVTDASHLIAICSMKTMDAGYIDTYVNDMAKTRGASLDTLKGYRDMMTGYIARQTPAETAEWIRRQSYLALGTLLVVAAELQIDACPMEGFDRTKIDELLGLSETNFTVASLCPVGFRASDDAMASMKKVRFPLQKLVEYK